MSSGRSFAEVRAAHGRIPATTADTSKVSLRYEDITKESLLGMGGSAQVYRATVDGDDSGTIALKEPRFDVPDEQVAEMFAQEAELWSFLEHEYILGVLDYGTEPCPWIALEYADGGTLADHEQENLEHSLWLAIALADGVKYAHKHGVVHLDLKPENILFHTTPADTWDIPQVTDWGLAKLLLKYTGEIEGLSFQYAAPEQCRPEQYHGADEKTDIYQLGAVIYALLTGRPPVSGSRQEMVDQTLAGAIDPPSSVNPSLPSFLDAPIMQALETNPEDRYEDVLLIRQALERAFLDVYTIEDTPQPRVNVRRTGTVGAPGPTTAVGVNWQLDGAFVPAGPPAVVDDTVYLTTRQGTIHALGVHTGAVQWGAKLGDGALTAPVIDEEQLYAADDSGVVYATPLTEQRQSWEATIGRSVRAAPIPNDDTIVLATVDGTVLAVEQSGTVAWETQAPGKVHRPPAVREGQLFVASFGGLGVVNVETGVRKWEYERVAPLRSAPVVVGETVFAAGRDAVVAIDITTGEKRWDRHLDDRSTGLAATTSHCYVSTGDGELIALDAPTGTEAWRFTKRNVAFTAPLIGEQTIFVGCHTPGSGTLPERMADVYAIDRETGAQRWTYATDTEVPLEPTITGDSLLVVGADGTLYSLE